VGNRAQGRRDGLKTALAVFHFSTVAAVSPALSVGHRPLGIPPPAARHDAVGQAVARAASERLRPPEEERLKLLERRLSDLRDLSTVDGDPVRCLVLGEVIVE
jgi:hypothetical protein